MDTSLDREACRTPSKDAEERRTRILDRCRDESHVRSSVPTIRQDNEIVTFSPHHSLPSQECFDILWFSNSRTWEAILDCSAPVCESWHLRNESYHQEVCFATKWRIFPPQLFSNPKTQLPEVESHDRHIKRRCTFLYIMSKSPTEELAFWINVSLFCIVLQSPQHHESWIDDRNGRASTGHPIILAMYFKKYWSMIPCLNCLRKMSSWMQSHDRVVRSKSLSLGSNLPEMQSPPPVVRALRKCA